MLDNQLAGYETVKHLIELGHRDIAILTGNSGHYTTRGRLSGYQQALAEAGIDVPAAYIQCGDYSIDGGYAAMLRLCQLAAKPTAVFVSNYDMTIGAYLAINYLNLKIPEDISIIGFDNFPLANVVKPALTFAEQPTDIMGRAAGKLLYRRIKGDYSGYPETLVYKPTIYYKDSIRHI